MANNYVESSFAFDLLNEAEEKWWKKESERDLAVEDPDGDLDLCDIEPAYSPDWAFYGKAGEMSILFTHDESINVDCAANLIQRFLKECRTDGCIGFTWAETCDKARLDEFGGGACCITADSQEWLNSHSWLDGCKKAFEKWGENWVVEMHKQLAGEV